MEIILALLGVLVIMLLAAYHVIKTIKEAQRQAHVSDIISESSADLIDSQMETIRMYSERLIDANNKNDSLEKRLKVVTIERDQFLESYNKIKPDRGAKLKLVRHLFKLDDEGANLILSGFDDDLSKVIAFMHYNSGMYDNKVGKGNITKE